MSNITIKQLFENRVHFGHSQRYSRPEMRNYVYTTRSRVQIIDLAKTKFMFDRALEVLERIAGRNGKILFVGTKFSARDIVREHALRAEMPFVSHRWLGGMLTNFKNTIKESVKRLKDLRAAELNGDFDKLTKREALMRKRELLKLDQRLGGIENMNSLPDALFVIDVGSENIAIKEANKLGIPVIAVVDTNCNPEGVDYIIPGNDDASKSIELFVSTAADRIIAARESTQAQAKASTEE